MLRSGWLMEDVRPSVQKKHSALSLSVVMIIIVATQVGIMAFWLHMGASTLAAVGLTLFMDVAGIIHMRR